MAATYGLLVSAIIGGFGGLSQDTFTITQRVRGTPEVAPPATLQCVNAAIVATLSWTANAEAPLGPGRFDLAFVDDKVKENDEVSSYVPQFDPLSDLVRYRVGWSSKEFRTTLKLYDREGKTYGDYESRQSASSGLLCENHLPVRGARIVFPESEWLSVSTDLALIDGIHFCEDDGTVRNREVSLPVRFVGKLSADKMLEKLVKVKHVRSGVLERVDGTPVVAAAIVATVKPDKK